MADVLTTLQPDAIPSPDQVQTRQFSRPYAGGILLLAALAAMLPAYLYGIPSGGDLTNHFRAALPFYESLLHGHQAPGWLAESNFGWGDPRFRFYPPGLYYLLAAFRWLCGNWYAATLATFTLLTALRGGGVWFWARSCNLKPQAAVLAGVAAMFVPFALVEFYQASLLSQFTGAALLPFALGFTERLTQKPRLAEAGGLAAAYALLIYSHLPLTVLGSLTLFAYALLRLPHGPWRRALPLLAGAVALALVAGASFWATMIAELPFIKSHQINPNTYYDYRNNFLFSPYALTNTNTWYSSFWGFATLAFFAPAMILLWRRKKDEAQPKLRAVAWVGLGALVMTTDLSRPVWWLVPKLKDVQFPFRWLTVVSLCGPLLLAASWEKWRDCWREMQARHFVPALGFLFALLVIVQYIIREAPYKPAQLFEEQISDARPGPSHKDWLPAQAQEVKNMPRLDAPAEAPGRALTVQTWTPQKRVFHVAAGAPVNARVKTYFYPHWQAAAGPRPLATAAGDKGELLIALPAEATTVTLDFVEPPRTRYAAYATGLAWLFIAFMVLSSALRRHEAEARTQ
jgi:hypothetical protein